jgi:hypothetical protein
MKFSLTWSPAKAGVQLRNRLDWVPACAGTRKGKL